MGSAATPSRPSATHDREGLDILDPGSFSSFSVKSMFAKLNQGPRVNYAKALWASRIAFKIRLFSVELPLL